MPEGFDNAISTKGLFSDGDNGADPMVFSDYQHEPSIRNPLAPLLSFAPTYPRSALASGQCFMASRSPLRYLLSKRRDSAASCRRTSRR